MQNRHLGKLTKYADICGEMEKNGWKCHVFVSKSVLGNIALRQCVFVLGDLVSVPKTPKNL